MVTQPRKGRPRRTAIAAVRETTNTCWICGYPIDLTLDYQTHRMASTVDERTPVSHGGSTTDPTNLAHAHRACNSARGNQPMTPALRHRIRAKAATILGITTTPPTPQSRCW